MFINLRYLHGSYYTGFDYSSFSRYIGVYYEGALHLLWQMTASQLWLRDSVPAFTAIFLVFYGKMVTLPIYQRLILVLIQNGILFAALSWKCVDQLPLLKWSQTQYLSHPGSFLLAVNFTIIFAKITSLPKILL